MLRSHSPKLSQSGVLASCLLTACAAMAAPSTEFSVDGAVTNPARYDLAALKGLPAITQTVTFAAGNLPQTHTYTGAGLWSILASAGIETRPTKNDILNRYVLAAGSDGYRAVFSLGELNPNFGNRPDLVAYAETTAAAATAPLVRDGFARVTAPGDVKGGRYVSNLVDLTVRSSDSAQAATGGGISVRFSVSGAVRATTGFDRASLTALPVKTETIGIDTFTGVSFWDLLDSSVGLSLNPAVKNDVLNHYVVATGSDGYKALFSLGELDTAFGDQPDLIAYEKNGMSLGANGFARIVVPNDVKAGRWVSNLVSLEVFTAAPVPEPSTAALMLIGLAVGAVAAAGRKAVR